MAVPVTVPTTFGSGDGEVRLAEWYQPEGATVGRGELVARLENDFAAIELEADANGHVRRVAAAGSPALAGKVVAYVLAPGERLPGEKPPAQPRPSGSGRKTARVPRVPVVLDGPTTAPDESTAVPDEAVAAPEEPPITVPERPGAYPLADVLRASARDAAANADVDALPGLPWDLFPADEGRADEEPFEAPKPLLLFPRIVTELQTEAAEEEDVPADTDEAVPASEVAEPPEVERTTAWELVPGESDFNPQWLLEPAERAADDPEPGREDRFQASNIRSLALGRDRDGGDQSTEDAEKPHDASATSQEMELPPAVVATNQALSTFDQLQDVRGEGSEGPWLHMRVAIDIGEAARMCDQLTREWWGSNVRPSDQDVVLRAIARALHESAHFRRRTDVVGLRPLSGTSRSVHLLADAATRPFRDAVASLTALRETPGADIPCPCTLTDFGALGLDEAVASLPPGQMLAFAMGVVRDVPRYQGDALRRTTELILTLSYDSGAMPEGAAARVLSRVRELVEAPYALLAD